MPTLEAEFASAEKSVANASAAWKATRKDATAAQDLIDQSLVALRTAEAALAARPQTGGDDDRCADGIAAAQQNQDRC